MFTLFDRACFALVNAYARHPVLDFVLPLFSEIVLLWLGLAALLVVYALYCRSRYGDALWRVVVLAIFLLLSAGAADLICGLIKDSVGRLRPFQSLEGVYYYSSERIWELLAVPHPPGATGGSFPSGHAAASMAVAVVISLLLRQSNPWVFLLPFLVGWSRVYIGRHYPLDIVAGWLVGLFSVLAVWILCHFLFRLFSSRRASPVRGGPWK